jgi:hypothetical protein
VAGLVIVKPHEEESLTRLRTLMQSGLAEGSTQLTPAGAVQSFGARGLAVDCTGVLDGASVRGRVWVTVSPHGGGGAIVLAVTTPDKVTPALLGAGAAVAGGLRYVKNEVTGLMLHLAGMWGTATAHTNTRIVFGRDGRFYANYESFASGRFTTSTGVQTGRWNYAGGRKAAGRWTVRGDKLKGRITVRMNDGSVNTYDYRVHVEKGRTYWREYYFNGRLYSKSN